MEKKEAKQKDDDNFSKLMAFSEAQKKTIEEQNKQIATRQLQFDEFKNEAKNQRDSLQERLEKLMAFSEKQQDIIIEVRVF